ncbi:E3 ubiquitin-protein ligase Bre1-like [Adelges cooleyi]|uniref:E3 ubiquitin-protein ligase Bre1-like n=1 Tax=Adelges cooleyi TaxID=133065 RepID=UPI00217F7BE5|nr:E3 ubiquitin-protein ligase Bre1-like [Adelges cooleyi]XP_050426215.1 E3 ubiquitin-protein ligase Bre1-like [Adelges cooleyi]
MSKRSTEEESNVIKPPLKKVRFGSVIMDPESSTDKSNCETIAEWLEQRNRLVMKLKSQIETLKNHRKEDKSLLKAVSRHWDQLNEDISVLLQRFNTEIADDFSSNNNETVIIKMPTMKEELDLDDRLAYLVHSSERAVAKIDDTLNRLVQKILDRTEALFKGEFYGNEAPTTFQVNQDNINNFHENWHLRSTSPTLFTDYRRNYLKLARLQDIINRQEEEQEKLRGQIEELQGENQNIQKRNDTIKIMLSK